MFALTSRIPTDADDDCIVAIWPGWPPMSQLHYVASVYGLKQFGLGALEREVAQRLASVGAACKGRLALCQFLPEQSKTLN